MPQSTASPLARVVYRGSGRGLSVDAEFVGGLLADAGYRVRMVRRKPGALRTRWQELVQRILRRVPPGLVRGFLRAVRATQALRPRADLSIHLQTPFLVDAARSKASWLVPNQEWFPPPLVPYVSVYSTIVCKTREALRIFTALHGQCQYLGFSGRYIGTRTEAGDPGEHVPGAGRFLLHIAGNSQQKGTEVVVQAWRRRPDWPPLVLVTDRVGQWGELPANVLVRAGLEPAEVTSLYAAAWAAVAPSLVEGFGHTLLEAMALGCPVLTTDAPPMNELVRPEFGIVIPARVAGQMRLGTRYRVEDTALNDAVDRVLALSETELTHMRASARCAAEALHHEAVTRWLEALREIP